MPPVEPPPLPPHVMAVRRAAAAQGVTRAVLAERAGYSPEHVRRLLAGRTRGTRRAWDALAAALGLPDLDVADLDETG